MLSGGAGGLMAHHWSFEQISKCEHLLYALKDIVGPSHRILTRPKVLKAKLITSDTHAFFLCSTCPGPGSRLASLIPYL